MATMHHLDAGSLRPDLTAGNHRRLREIAQDPVRRGRVHARPEPAGAGPCARRPVASRRWLTSTSSSATARWRSSTISWRPRRPGRGGFLLIEGLAGIGKTRVLAEVRRRAGTRMRVLSARGSELEGVVPVRRGSPALRGRHRRPGAAGDRADRRGGAAAGDVLGAPTGNTQAGNASFAVLHGLYWFAQNLADERPLVLAIDDLQWVDRPSLRFLAYLVHRLEGAPILLAATLRSSEPGIDPGAARGARCRTRRRAAAARPAEPRGGRGLVARAARRRTATTRSSTACHPSTGGNPLLLHQLLVALAADAVRPRRRRTSTSSRRSRRARCRAPCCCGWRGCPSEAGAVARAAAMLGEHAAPDAVAALAGVDQRGLADMTGALIEGGDPAAPSRPSASRTRSCATPSTRRSRRPSASCSTRAPPTCCATPGRPPSTSRPSCCSPRRAASAWVVEQRDGRGLRGDRPRRARRRGRVLPARARRAARGRGARPACSAPLGVIEAQTSGPGAAEHLREVLASHGRPVRAGGDRPGPVAASLIFTGRAGGGQRGRPAARDGLPDTPEARDVRLGLEAVGVIAAVFGVVDDAQLALLAEHRHPPQDAGVGEKLLAAIAVYAWAQTDGTAEECCAAALDLLRDGRLQLADDPLDRAPARSPSCSSPPTTSCSRSGNASARRRTAPARCC